MNPYLILATAFGLIGLWNLMIAVLGLFSPVRQRLLIQTAPSKFVRVQFVFFANQDPYRFAISSRSYSRK